MTSFSDPIIILISRKGEWHQKDELDFDAENGKTKKCSHGVVTK